MASEKEIQKQGDQFLHALRPKPIPPASRTDSKNASPAPVVEKPPKVRSPAPPDTDGVSEYMNTFIYDRSNLNFRKSPRQVLVNRDMHELIQRITLIIGENEISVAGYVNNVLSLHLKEYDGLIHRLLKEKFNNTIP